MAKNKKRRIDLASKKDPSHAPKKAARTSASQKASLKQSQKQKQQATSIIPFDPNDRILLIGEGDFSFTKSIIDHHGCCDVTATCFDSRTDLLQKYSPQAEEHVDFLLKEGQTVLYGVDATKLDAVKGLKGKVFEKIIFNFPHVGGKTKDVNRQVRFNQELLVGFFKSATAVLAPGGTIVVTLLEGEPYSLWNPRDLARHCGLEVQMSFRFASEAYPGYAHARTLGNIEGGGGWKGEEREARSFVFGVKGAVPAGARSGGGVAKGKRKRKRQTEKEKEMGSDGSDDDD